ncbi:hypothetical protein DESC_370122 [Desulfosarcina cetonica]|uniref:hypothetical protein n=1 Tax=Desulfosarcina cetonica TaxID=90730 RepID=UPI0006D02643|nr:hypothetical protein [Desulfosarcina cetonica]VTR65753.1 hypothetical protein DESC_370122 [Desulfosarcina cetonica]
MKFSDFFVPRWQHSNPSVRKRAISRLRDIQLLEQIAGKDSDAGVCQAAADQLESLQVKETAS